VADGVSDKTVSIFGSGEAAESSAAYETARAAGRAVAQAGFVVANGGYGGTMEASARGAKEAGGETVGVTCRIWRSQPNRWIDRVIETADLSERVDRLVELGTGGYVVLPGATGTLVELAIVWEKLCKGMMVWRPLVCVGDFWRPLIDMMKGQRPRGAKYVAVAADAGELARHLTGAEGVE